MRMQRTNQDHEFDLNETPQFGTNNGNMFIPFSSFPSEAKASISVNEFQVKMKAFDIIIATDEQNYHQHEGMKIEIKQQSIQSVVINSNKHSSLQKTFLFFLFFPPKIFQKPSIGKMITCSSPYFLKFPSVISKFSYGNHCHIIKAKDENRNESISEDIIVKHQKKETHSIKEPADEEEEKQMEKETIKTHSSNNFGFIRIDSELSKGNEYLNFYLLNLIMKVTLTFKSKEEYEDFLSLLHLRGLIDHSKKEKYFIPSEEEFTKSEYLLIQNLQSFYKYFIPLHFNVQFSILSLITQKRFNIFNFNTDFLKTLGKYSCEERNLISYIIDEINKETRNANYLELNLKQVIEIKYNDLIHTSDKATIDEINNELLIRTIEVTPSLAYYRIPKREKTNHLLRKMAEYRDHFIKINILDEENQKIYFTSQSMLSLVSFVEELMRKGIMIGTRSFSFLSASYSQMKNCSFWFFNIEGTKYVDCEHILKEVGDFTKETNVFKNAARRGQCLSSTIFIKTLPSSSIQQISDIKRNGYVFSDGIGQISFDLANECTRKIKKSANYASAFQIRIGGVKGLLAVNPALKGETICIRPSMTKYESKDTALCVIRCSNYSMGNLNRQIISLLTTLGVPGDIFLSMQQKEIEKYDALLTNPNTILRETQSSSFDILFSKCFFFLPLIKTIANKFKTSLKDDPFTSSILLAVTTAKILDLKTKCKIIDKRSAMLLGVIDETNTLKEGEVYVQISQISPHSKQGSIFTLNQEVFVTKNPCLHPGDVKVLTAKPNCPLLTHMVNVIVFSSQGRRPVHNEISGGDLDGDIYYVSWNEDIIKEIIHKNVSSLEDPNKIQMQQMPKAININDIINTYLDYLKNDTISTISNYHSAFADNDLIKGAFNEKCLKLAKLFSIAIDAPKTGQFIHSSSFEEYSVLLKEMPDFLQIANFKQYQSPGILGQLFRACNSEGYIYQVDQNEYQMAYLQNYTINDLFLSENSVEYCLDALHIYSKYQGMIKNLMQEYKITTECELFIGENIHNRQKNKHIKSNDVFSELHFIQDYFSNEIKTTFTKITFDVASAFYLVTYLNDKSILEQSNYYHDNCPGLITAMNDLKLLSIPVTSNRLSLDKSIEKDGFYLTFEEYRSAINRSDMSAEIIKHKRVFSLPWFIKEIREALLYPPKKNIMNYIYFN